MTPRQVFPLDGFRSSQTPRDKLTLHSPGCTSFPRNIFLFLLTAISRSQPQTLTVSLNHLVPSHIQSISKFCQVFLKQLFLLPFLSLSTVNPCWTWITLQSLNGSLYNLTHSILPDILMPERYSLNTLKDHIKRLRETLFCQWNNDCIRPHSSLGTEL